MSIDWNKIEKKDLFSEKLYEAIYNNIDEELKFIDKALSEGIKLKADKAYSDYKKNRQLEESLNSVIDFGEKAPIRKMVSPGYYKDKNGHIRNFDKNTLVTATLIEPVAILKNQETEEELVKCAYLNRNRWQYVIINRETILHNGKITRLANKGIDVTSDSARLLVGFLRDLLYSNEIPEYVSTSKMGWHDGEFLPYDESIEFDGEDAFQTAFESLHEQGSFEKWYEQVSYDRKDNVPLKLVMATSFASPLLHILERQSFVTLLWGGTDTKKTVSGRIAMSIWGDSQRGKLMFSMNNTTNYYFRIADFFNHIPVFFDELQTLSKNVSVDKLIMNITEGIDRGKATAEGGVEKSKHWNNTFIFTGEESASNINSGGGTLNRLIEIYVAKSLVEDGIKTCNVLNDNYGTAGKKFIDFIKTLSKESLQEKFNEKYKELMALSQTESKQAINMAMLLLADDLACQCIFKNETPLKAEQVAEYMFTKKEIDNTERAYETFLDEIEINRTKFQIESNSNTEFWGFFRSDGNTNYTVCIVGKKLRDILMKNGFNYTKALKDWERKGLVHKNKFGKFVESISHNGIKGNFIEIKIRKEEE